MLEMAAIIVLGITAQWIAWKIKVPAILPLLLIGLAVGPFSSYWTGEEGKWLEPMFQESTGKGLFPGNTLFYFVSLAIGIILFEGGLTLKRKEIRGVGPVIGKLITLGSLVTFVGAGVAAHFIIGLSWQISLLFAGLIIVTGPTVIAPILQNIPLSRKVSAVLKWEGILIDPIGALVAVLVFQYIISVHGVDHGHGAHGGEDAFTTEALRKFATLVLIGLSLGFLAAHALAFMLRKKLIPHYLLNVFSLAMVMGVFVLSDVLEHESGLLTVVVMGMVLGNMDLPQIKEILFFKESLSVLLISILFILLAANINMEDLQLLMDIRTIILFLVVILVLRPLGVFLSTHGSELKLKEKIFISWVGPRGIVAAGIASLFGLRLSQGDHPVAGAEYIVPLVFLIVLGTVLLNATTARLFARLLGVTLPKSNGVLIVGANYAGRVIGKYLADNDRHVVLIDSNQGYINLAKEAELEAFSANVYTDDLDDKFDLLDMGYLFAMTSSSEVNEFVCGKFKKNIGENGTFKLISSQELKSGTRSSRFLSQQDDYLNLNNIARDYPNMHEVTIENLGHYDHILSTLSNETYSAPFFLKNPDDSLVIIPESRDGLNMQGKHKLVYLGKELDEEKLEHKVEDPLDPEAEKKS